MLFKTINQCNSFKTGMMWAYFLVKQSSLAAAQSHRSYILPAEECFFFFPLIGSSSSSPSSPTTSMSKVMQKSVY